MLLGFGWITTDVALHRIQHPKFMVIGCADSRVDASEIMGLPAGSLFMHRNIANMVVDSDLNILANLQYALDVVHVRDIVVLGHYGCGGVQASMTGNVENLGLVEHWLRNIRDVQRLHDKELRSITDTNEKFRRLVELNVQVCMHAVSVSLRLSVYPCVCDCVCVCDGVFVRVFDLCLDVAWGGFNCRNNVSICSNRRSYSGIFVNMAIHGYVYGSIKLTHFSRVLCMQVELCTVTHMHVFCVFLIVVVVCQCPDTRPGV